MSSEMEVRRSRGKPARNSGQQVRGKQSTSEFVNRELSADETQLYRQWRSDIDDVDLTWRKALDDGYKFSVKYDDYSDSIVCFMFPDDTSSNGGFILTGRGGTGYRALAECLYKHQEIFGGEWSRGLSRVDGPNDPDW